MKLSLVATAAAISFFASPALAGWARWAPAQAWTCSAYEYAHWCNAEWNIHTHRCGCLVR